MLIHVYDIHKVTPFNWKQISFSFCTVAFSCFLSDKKEKALKITASHSLSGGLMSKGGGIRHDPSGFKTNGHICKHCAFAHANNVLRPWSAFYTQKHSFSQHRTQSTLTEAEELAFAAPWASAISTLSPTENKGETAPALIPNTSPFSSRFWKTLPKLSLDAKVNNFCPARSPLHSRAPRGERGGTQGAGCPMGSRAAVSAAAWVAAPHPHQPRSGFARQATPQQEGPLMPVWALLPLTPWWHGAPFVIFLSSLKTVKTAQYLILSFCITELEPSANCFNNHPNQPRQGRTVFLGNGWAVPWDIPVTSRLASGTKENAPLPCLGLRSPIPWGIRSTYELLQSTNQPKALQLFPSSLKLFFYWNGPTPK